MNNSNLKYTTLYTICLFFFSSCSTFTAYETIPQQNRFSFKGANHSIKPYYWIGPYVKDSSIAVVLNIDDYYRFRNPYRLTSTFDQDTVRLYNVQIKLYDKSNLEHKFKKFEATKYSRDSITIPITKSLLENEYFELPLIKMRNCRFTYWYDNRNIAFKLKKLSVNIKAKILFKGKEYSFDNTFRVRKYKDIQLNIH